MVPVENVAGEPQSPASEDGGRILPKHNSSRYERIRVIGKGCLNSLLKIPCFLLNLSSRFIRRRNPLPKEGRRFAGDFEGNNFARGFLFYDRVYLLF